MTNYTLTIDDNALCPRCGQPGAVNGGLCLTCANRHAAELHQRESSVWKRWGELERQARDLGLTVPLLHGDMTAGQIEAASVVLRMAIKLLPRCGQAVSQARIDIGLQLYKA